MPDELLPYYERELTFLRQMGAEFAEKYPKVAGRLLLDPSSSEDPHVERLMQAFAFLTARVHHKIDDEFPEVTEALLHVLYPHYLAPIPSMSIAQFVLDPQRGKLTRGHTIERGAVLYAQPVHGTSCRFRTCYPVTLWPIEVAAARLETASGGLGVAVPTAAALLRLELRCLGGTGLNELALDHVRVFLHGESSLTSTLYELLLNHTCQVLLRPLNAPQSVKPLVCPPSCIRPVGFDPDEGMLPYSPRSFLGYRLLQEYFAFPDKFLFVDIGGLDRAVQAGFRDGVEVIIMLDRRPRLEQTLSPETFRLGCAPIVNLFEQIAEPIRVTHTQTDYRVIPDTRQQQTTEVYSLDAVTQTSPYAEASIAVQPFYALRHGTARDEQPAFWYAKRCPSRLQGDAGTEVYLSLVNRDFQPALPAAETLTVHTTCTNRDLPGKLPFGGTSGDFELEGVAPLLRIRCLKKPTETLRSALGKGAQWRLISHLSLNYLSLCNGGKDALQEILRLYDFTDSAVVHQHIAGITDITCRRVIGRPPSRAWNGFCRGLEVTIAFDEEQYVGSGLFLFASVLERFFGLYTSLNSFTQLIATTHQREEPLKQWPPRAGEQILL